MPMPDHHIIVTIHDQDLLLDYEAQGKFRGHAAVTYVFVGMGPIDKLGGLDNVVIARDLADNIEDMKYLVDFTSWYACVRNSLIDASFVSLIQYDVVITDDFSTTSLDAMTGRPRGILGYCPVPMKNRNFIRDNMGYAPLRDACEAVYGIDIKSIFKTYQRKGADPLWPATNNVSMHRDTLAAFVDWFEPLARHMGNARPVGHAFERAIKLFAVLHGRDTFYADTVLDHFQLDSHETQGLKKNTGALHAILSGRKS